MEIVINLAGEALQGSHKLLNLSEIWQTYSLSEFVVFFFIFWFLGPGDPLLDHKQTKNLQDAKA